MDVRHQYIVFVSSQNPLQMTDAMCLLVCSHLYKVVSYYFGCHEDKHDGKAEGDISRSLHHDNSQTESHPHNATCGEQHIITRTILICSYLPEQVDLWISVIRINYKDGP